MTAGMRERTRSGPAMRHWSRSMAPAATGSTMMRPMSIAQTTRPPRGGAADGALDGRAVRCSARPPRSASRSSAAYLALRSFAVGEAKRDTRTRLLENASSSSRCCATICSRATRRRSPRSTTSSLTGVLGSVVIRVKLWSADGRVLYSDNPAQIGDRFTLDDEASELLVSGGAEVEETQLTGRRTRSTRRTTM